MSLIFRFSLEQDHANLLKLMEERQLLTTELTMSANCFGLTPFDEYDTLKEEQSKTLTQFHGNTQTACRK